VIATTAGEWAALIIAGFWAILVIVVSLLTMSFLRVVSSLRSLVDGITQETVPLLDEVGTTVKSVNREIDRIDGVLVAGQRITENVATISETVKATVTNPLVKFLASMAGARRAWGKMREK
jgi:uncharacterized protein YoxC